VTKDYTNAICKQSFFNLDGFFFIDVSFKQLFSSSGCVHPPDLCQELFLQPLETHGRITPFWCRCSHDLLTFGDDAELLDDLCAEL
jgi:hypothetical protein